MKSSVWSLLVLFVVLNSQISPNEICSFITGKEESALLVSLGCIVLVNGCFSLTRNNLSFVILPLPEKAKLK